MIYIKLFAIFFKMGIFSFGGGYAMIPLIQKELQKFNKISIPDIYNLVAISEVTPGSISVNLATFVGYEIAGFLGATFATLGIIMPSFIIILVISSYLMKYEEKKLIKDALFYVKPVISALIIVAAYYVAQTSIFKKDINLYNIMDIIKKPLSYVDLKATFILLIAIIMIKRHNIHPIAVMIISGLIGILLFYIF